MLPSLYVTVVDVLCVGMFGDVILKPSKACDNDADIRLISIIRVLIVNGLEMNISIKRNYTGKLGTFGTIQEENQPPFALTLEREWHLNERNISCIPAGNYQCKRVQSPKFGNTFEVKDVPHRSHILFHKGNLYDDSHGCILIGEQYDFIGEIPAVLSSRKGFAEFTHLTRNTDDFNLKIYNYF